MKRQFAITAAKWLAKRENRDKVMNTVRDFKQRIEHEQNRSERPVDDTHRGHDSDHHRR